MITPCASAIVTFVQGAITWNSNPKPKCYVDGSEHLDWQNNTTQMEMDDPPNLEGGEGEGLKHNKVKFRQEDMSERKQRTSWLRL